MILIGRGPSPGPVPDGPVWAVAALAGLVAMTVAAHGVGRLVGWAGLAGALVAAAVWLKMAWAGTALALAGIAIAASGAVRLAGFLRQNPPRPEAARG